MFRKSNGKYDLDDWTSISDIGKTFEGKLLSVDEYKCIEDKYVKVVKLIMDFISAPILIVDRVQRSSGGSDFEITISKYSELYNQNCIIDLYQTISDKMELSSEQIESLIRLLLREDIGAEVYFENKLNLFIGYDFLMGIHTSNPIDRIIADIEEIGLFVESF
jgi:hypothetical protein